MTRPLTSPRTARATGAGVLSLVFASFVLVILLRGQARSACPIALSVDPIWQGPYIRTCEASELDTLHGFIANGVGAAITFKSEPTGTCGATDYNREFWCSQYGGLQIGGNVVHITATYDDPGTGEHCETAPPLPYEVFCDKGPPELHLVYPAQGSIVSSTDSVIINATDDVAVKTIWANDSAIWTNPLAEQMPPPYLWVKATAVAYSSPNVSVPLAAFRGDTTLHVTAQDGVYRSASPADWRFIVDADAPRVSIALPVSTGTLSAINEIKGNASDDIALKEVLVTARVDGGAMLDERRIPLSGPTSEWTYTGLAGRELPAPASITVTAVAEDTIGRKSVPVQARIIMGQPIDITVPKTVERNAMCRGRTNRSNGDVNTEGSSLQHSPGSLGLSLNTSHNSQGAADSPWGYGWGCTQDPSITARDNGALVWIDGSGTQRAYYPSRVTPGKFIRPINTYTDLAVRALAPDGKPAEVEQQDKDGLVTRYARQTGDLLAPVLFTGRDQSTITQERDAAGKLLTAADIHNRRMTVTYNGQGRVATVSDGFGGTMAFEYDLATGDKTSQLDALGDPTSYTYDSSHRITAIGYPNGGARTYVYDAAGRVLEEQDGLGENKNTYSYYPSSTVVTDALSRATVYEWASRSGLKLPRTIIDPLGKTTSMLYDRNLNLVKRTDPLGRITEYTYDAEGSVLTVQDPRGKTTAITYDPELKLPSAITDPMGRTTWLEYDHIVRALAAVQDPLGHRTVFSYTGYADVKDILDPMGKKTSFTYDPLYGGLASVTDPLNRTTQLERDPWGHVTLNRDPKGLETRFTYDLGGNLTEVRDALEGVTSYEYAPGRAGRLLAKVVDAERQGSQKGTVFGYDSVGRLKTVTNALGQKKSFDYDKKGNLIWVEDAKRQVITFEYDGLDRLIRKNLPNGEGTVIYEYDDAGNLTRVSHPNGSIIAMSYDPLDRVAEVRQTLPGGYTAVITYGYDDNGNRTSMGTPWGGFSYTYDAANRLTSIINPEGRIITFVYDANGRRTKLTYPNGIETSYAYDDAGQLTGIEAKRTADGVVVASAAYTYDLDGNRTSMADPAGLHNYGYDPLHRLISAQHPADSFVETKNESFAYDRVGNRGEDARIQAYHYDDANRLTDNSSYTYTYDDNGNQTSKTDKATGELTEYLYDSENRLIEAKINSQSIGRYIMDALGRRIEKSTGPAADPTVTRFVYDGFNILAMLDASNQPVAVFTQGLGINEPLIMRKAGDQEFFYYADALGSIAGLTDIAGQIVERVEYGAYGQPTFIDVRGPPQASTKSFVGILFAFTGLFRDEETRLYRSTFRSYDVNTGRFLQEDPLGLGARDVNRYIYVGNSPTRFVDRMGLAKCVYAIGEHWMICSSNDGNDLIMLGPEGVFSGRGDCLNAPTTACINAWRKGPIAPGEYAMNQDQRSGNSMYWRLERIPPVRWWEYVLGIRRSGFILHPGSVSEGCVTAEKTNSTAQSQYKRIHEMLLQEAGQNTLTVIE